MDVNIGASSSGGLKQKWSSFRGACSTKWNAMKSGGASRLQSAKSSMSSRMTSMRSGVESSMRGNPAKWAGIAAGAGLGVGLAGRMLRHRMESRRMPELIVIEAAC